jgi:hypothetical protein
MDLPPHNHYEASEALIALSSEIIMVLSGRLFSLSCLLLARCSPWL